jgi:general stress protein 26
VSRCGAIWFATDRGAGKIDDIRADAHVNVSLQGGGKFVSLSGAARVVDDPRKVEEVWNEEMRVWFPGGKQDPRLTLLCVEPREGEFWDSSGTNAIKYLFKAGVAYLRGERPTDDEAEHGRVRLS